MSDLLTSSGIRPLVGNYALDPNQQQQVALWQTYQDYGKPKTIEDWLKIKPNAELVAEQWRQMTERVKPKRQRNTTDWIASAAR